MYTLKSVNYNTRHCLFSIDSEKDLESLPNQHKAGKGTLSTIGSCAMGSVAHSTDGKTYVLNGDTNEWVLYNGSNNISLDTFYNKEEIDNLINESIYGTINTMLSQTVGEVK